MLIYAARDGRLAIVQWLIDHGADLNWIDGWGVTSSILKVFRNNPSIAALLLSHGPNAPRWDKRGRRAMEYALRRGIDDPAVSMLRASRQ